MTHHYVPFFLLAFALTACGRKPPAPLDGCGDAPGNFKITWLVSGDIQEGARTLEGNRLTFTWKSMAGTGQNLSGHGTYTVTVNGKIYGQRYIDGADEPGTEAVYPTRNSSPIVIWPPFHKR